VNAKMMLVSDGEENTPPLVDSPEVQREIERCKITIDSMLISRTADTVLIDLSAQTSGSSFYLNPQSPNWKDALQAAIAEMSKAALTPEERSSVCQVNVQKIHRFY